VCEGSECRALGIRLHHSGTQGSASRTHRATQKAGGRQTLCQGLKPGNAGRSQKCEVPPRKVAVVRHGSRIAQSNRHARCRRIHHRGVTGSSLNTGGGPFQWERWMVGKKGFARGSFVQCSIFSSPLPGSEYPIMHFPLCGFALIIGTTQSSRRHTRSPALRDRCVDR
jgi:hypothetical protein